MQVPDRIEDEVTRSINENGSQPIPANEPEEEDGDATFPHDMGNNASGKKAAATIILTTRGWKGLLSSVRVTILEAKVMRQLKASIWCVLRTS